MSTQQVERSGVELVEPFLREEYPAAAGWSFEPVTTEEGQRHCGDYRAGRARYVEFIEVKAALRTYPDMAIELVQSCARGNPGWFYELRYTTRMLWAYLDSGVVWTIDYRSFQLRMRELLDQPPVPGLLRFNSAEARGRSSGTALNWLLPWSYLEGLGICRRWL